MDWLQIVGPSILSGGAAGAALVWLLKAWISTRLTESIKAEYADRAAELKAHLDAQNASTLARLQSDLARMVDEHKTQFALVANERAPVLKDLLKYVVTVRNTIGANIKSLQLDRPQDVPYLADTMNSTQAAYSRYRDEHAFLLPQSLVVTLRNFDLATDRIIHNFRVLQDTTLTVDERCKGVADLDGLMRGSISKMVENIEHDLRLLIGADAR